MCLVTLLSLRNTHEIVRSKNKCKAHVVVTVPSTTCNGETLFQLSTSSAVSEITVSASGSFPERRRISERLLYTLLVAVNSLFRSSYGLNKITT